MNNDHLQPVILELQQQGLIDANATVQQTVKGDDQQDTPWFIQVLFGFSGLFASLFFIGFLSLILFETRVFDSAISLMITGLLLSAIGFALFRNKRLRNNAFMSSLAFAISFAGQVYAAFALESADLSPPVDVWGFLLLQGFMTLIMSNRIYRLLSAMITLGCLIYLFNYYQMPEASLGLLALVTVISNLQRYELLRYLPIKWRSIFLEVLSAIAYASAIMLLAVSVYFIAAEYGNGFGYDEVDFYYNYPLAQTLLTLASLYAAYLILKRYPIKIQSAPSLVIGGAIIILGVISVYVSGLLATSLIIIIATANSQRVLLALGVAALVGYVFWYYYQLDTSLLIKAISMLIIGITVLLMRWLLLNRYAINDKAPARMNDEQERLL